MMVSVWELRRALDFDRPEFVGGGGFQLNLDVNIWVAYIKHLSCGRCLIYKNSLLFPLSVLPAHCSVIEHLTCSL